MASAVTLQVYQDFVFHNLDLETMLTLPVKTLASQPQQQEGALFYNLTDNLPYVSAGTSWLPVLTGTTDVASNIILVAPLISLNGDTLGVSINATAANSGVVINAAASGGTITATAERGMTVQSQNGNLTIGSINGSLIVDEYSFVLQLTNINTAVTADSISGEITTQAAATAAEGTDTFVVNNDRATGGSLVFLSLVEYTGTGLPFLSVTSRGAGVFTVVISNASSGAPLNSTLKIGFLVLEPPASP